MVLSLLSWILYKMKRRLFVNFLLGNVVGQLTHVFSLPSFLIFPTLFLLDMLGFHLRHRFLSLLHIFPLINPLIFALLLRSALFIVHLYFLYVQSLISFFSSLFFNLTVDGFLS